MCFKLAQKVGKFLGGFCEMICYLDPSKIDQSGHTAFNLRTRCCNYHCMDILQFYKFGLN